MLIPLMRVLEYLERTEQKAELLYRRLAGRFASDSAVAMAFSRLADQEKAHRDIILFQMRALRGAEEVFEKIEFEAAELLAVHDEIDRAMKQRDIPLQDAVALCIRMEDTLLERHRNLAAEKIGGDLLRMMESMVNDDAAHAEILADLIRHRG